MNIDMSSVICDVEDIDFVILNFLLKLLIFICECILEKMVIIRLKDKLWFDLLLRRIIRKCDCLCNLVLKYNCEIDWIKFRNIRN